MGTSIGQIPSTLIAARRRPPATELAPARGERATFDLTQPGSRPGTSPAASQNPPGPETPQPGFGPGTVSGPAAALITIDRTVRAAREAVPTLDEIRAQFQINRAAADSTVENPALRSGEGVQGSESPTVPAADPLGFTRFNEARAFSESAEFEPVQLASAQPPEAPELASAEQPDEVPPPPEPESVPVPADAQRRGLNLTA